MLTCRPIRPYPTTPRVDPARSPTVTEPRSAQRPERTRSVNGPNRLTRCMAMARAPSATATAPVPGVTTTAIPRAVAARRSTRSTPTPVRATTRSRGARSRNGVSMVTSARATAPCASRRSSSVGSAAKRHRPVNVPATRPGSTTPRPITKGSCSDMSGKGGAWMTERRTGDLRDLVPLPVDRRRGGGRDDLGVGQGLIDAGAELLTIGDRDEELLRLDHLQVVVPHGVARAGLEARVVTLRLVAQDGGVTLVRPRPPDREPKLVHALEAPRGRALGAVDLEAETALRSHDDPGRLQGADSAGTRRVCREPDESPDVVVVLHLTELTVLDHGEVRAGSHGQDRALLVDRREQRGDVGDRADHVLDEVHDMAQQVAKSAAAGKVLLEPPGQGAVGLGRVAVEEDRSNVGDPTEVAVRDHRSDTFDRGGVAVVVADRGGDPGGPGPKGDWRGLGGVAPDRLLDPEWLPGGGGRNADLAMQQVGRADRHDLDVRVGEDRAIVGAGPGVPEDVPRVVGAVGSGVGRVHQPGSDLELRVDHRYGLVGAAVQLAHPADADQADAQLGVAVGGEVSSHGGVVLFVREVRVRARRTRGLDPARCGSSRQAGWSRSRWRGT